MKIGMDARVAEKIVKTLMSADKMAKISYLGDGVDEGVTIFTSSPDYSFCSIQLTRGWADLVEMSGSSGESFVLDLTEFRAAFLKVKGQRASLINIDSDPDSEFILLSGPNGSEKVEKRSFEVKKQMPEATGEAIKFRINGPKIKRILGEIVSTDDTVNITLGEYKIATKIGPESQVNEGYGICFWKTEADELFVSSEPLTTGIKLDGFPDGFTVQYFVESITNAINEIGSAKKESTEISVGPRGPMRIRFRLAETVYVEYTQVPKKVIKLGIDI